MQKKLSAALSGRNTKATLTPHQVFGAPQILLLVGLDDDGYDHGTAGSYCCVSRPSLCMS